MQLDLCLYSHLLEYNLLLYSCDGDPEFIRGMPLALPVRVLPLAAIEYLEEPMLGGSRGEVAAVDEPERGCC